jgi:hypothetical protein
MGNTITITREKLITVLLNTFSSYDGSNSASQFLSHKHVCVCVCVYACAYQCVPLVTSLYLDRSVDINDDL